MRFAVKTASHNTEWAAVLDLWREADRIELFESGWNFDHFQPIFSDPSGPCLEGWTMLAALAQATSRIRLGCMVTGNPHRHPSVLAKMAATVDVISNGRLELGLGAGWNEPECETYGIELPPMRQRFERFEEACEIIVGLLTEPRLSFDGSHYRLVDAPCEPKAVQRPHPPICIGGGGERRTLRAVARWAQIWNLVSPDEATLRHKIEVLAGHCADIGRDPSEITVSAQLAYDPGAGIGPLVEQIAELGGAGMELAIVNLPPPHSPAMLAPLADALQPLASR